MDGICKRRVEEKKIREADRRKVIATRVTANDVLLITARFTI